MFDRPCSMRASLSVALYSAMTFSRSESDGFAGAASNVSQNDRDQSSTNLGSSNRLLVTLSVSSFKSDKGFLIFSALALIYIYASGYGHYPDGDSQSEELDRKRQSDSPNSAGRCDDDATPSAHGHKSAPIARHVVVGICNAP